MLCVDRHEEDEMTWILIDGLFPLALVLFLAGWAKLRCRYIDKTYRER